MSSIQAENQFRMYNFKMWILLFTSEVVMDVHVSCPLIREKAMKFEGILNIEIFQAGVGWLN